MFDTASFCILGMTRGEFRLRKLVPLSLLNVSGKTTVLADPVSVGSSRHVVVCLGFFFNEEKDRADSDS